ncbi:MAG TPA: GNAT family N-acetyltransferase [Candidatus Bathyarchaeota archaeon]|nr:GNAT family N-acetyltransferase [Candidatus Bathyarchaeota archaeon]
MEISTRIITDFKDILNIERIWNLELVKSVENPQLYSRLFAGVMHSYESKGWTPLVITFWSDNRIVGMAPLKMRKVFSTNYVCSLLDEAYSDFVFFDKYQEYCMNMLVDILFNRLNCRLAIISLDTNSPNLKLLEKTCLKKNVPFSKKQNSGRAIIPVETTWEQFYKSLKGRARKEFRRIKRKLDSAVSWNVSCAEINDESIKKILAVDQKSWKAEWRAEHNLEEDPFLHTILEASQPDGEVEPIYKSEVWFLEANGEPIAYQIVQFYKGTAVLIKTSFDANFKRFSPGKFLINIVIREVFRKGTVNKIDFVTNLPFVQDWRPSCEPRTQVIIEENPFLSCAILLKLKQVHKFKKRSYLLNIHPVAKLWKILESYLHIK